MTNLFFYGFLNHFMYGHENEASIGVNVGRG